MASNYKTVHFDPKNMQFRFLGPSGLRVSAFSLGGWLTYGNTGYDIEHTKKCLKQAWDLGINTFDTAEVYSQGNSEIVMGKAIQELGWNRSEYVLITKVYFGAGPKLPNTTGLSRKHIIEGVYGSLKRLDTDYVDVVMAHRYDPSVPMEEIVRAFTHLIHEGKTFYWGTSEWSAFEIEHAHHIATKYSLIAPIADQPQYNYVTRDHLEKDLLPLQQIYGYGSTVWSPLKFGILTGKYNDGIPENSRLNTTGKQFAAHVDSQEGKTQIQQVRQVSKIAERIGATPAQFALAWTLKNPHVSTTILGASKPEQIIENVKALEFVDKLTPEILKELDEILNFTPLDVQYRH
ncbi:potassium channel subunit [Schizosaccharomyces cryophilus OY26]|uniref:Potassium channel subunit n=1 Tax=Schizosaccharomyces cryophilus (strain OY26 / ATCC MYA-4695 / CBS 11777 / NBRC 106824 / NRRL Y48691) TaxID=653667 RepID=S9XFE0_SCHCR|nr:potassium channel subunit [Schizosaccharomyces cryophilus OY26]EPY52326.1 potassium channel subunit [Schizosaccharomyces cryophilus OY26]